MTPSPTPFSMYFQLQPPFHAAQKRARKKRISHSGWRPSRGFFIFQLSFSGDLPPHSFPSKPRACLFFTLFSGAAAPFYFFFNRIFAPAYLLFCSNNQWRLLGLGPSRALILFFESTQSAAPPSFHLILFYFCLRRLLRRACSPFTIEPLRGSIVHSEGEGDARASAHTLRRKEGLRPFFPPPLRIRNKLT